VTRTTLSALPEEDLLQRAAQGDHAAFTELVKRYEETVYRFSLKLCRDPARAEEVLQDTFINVFRKLHSFDGKSKFSTWLYTIVTNNCLMKRRKRKLEELEDSLQELDAPATDHNGRFLHQVARWDETPADIVLKRELRQKLDDAILKLPELYRAVFVLRDVEGKSTEETAQILQITVEATKSRLRRARAFLREQLDPYMTGHRGHQDAM
jgi:RNA polymerase sigma-70 factor (ECF subfamily)